MGGTLQVESEMGQGSTFWFEIPLKVAAPSSPQPATPQPAIIGFSWPQAEPPRILAVDDNPANCTLLQDMLQPLGFHIKTTTRAADALAQVDTWHPHLIITDLLMPEMDGFELIKELGVRSQALGVRGDESGLEGSSLIPNSQFPIPNPPKIIASSASVYEADQTRSLDLGADAFLPKPVELEQLLARLQILLNLTWHKADPAPPAIPLIAPPPAMLDKLLNLINIGDIHGVETAAQTLKTDYPGFVAALLQQTATFQTQKVQNWLTEFKEKP
jgi:CheY-like chemotaxis protein